MQTRELPLGEWLRTLIATRRTIRGGRLIEMKCGFLVVGWLLVAGSTLARAATWHVSTTGSDAQAGTLAAPFRTIQRAADVMAPGDTCLIRQGTYRETVRPANSGTVSAPLIFSPYNGEAVTVSGCDVISGWQSYSGYAKKAATDFG